MEFRGKNIFESFHGDSVGFSYVFLHAAWKFYRAFRIDSLGLWKLDLFAGKIHGVGSPAVSHGLPLDLTRARRLKFETHFADSRMHHLPSEVRHRLSEIRRRSPLANLAFHPFEVHKWVVSCNRIYATSLGWRLLINAYGVTSARYPGVYLESSSTFKCSF